MEKEVERSNAILTPISLSGPHALIHALDLMMPTCQKKRDFCHFDHESGGLL
jgi:hypothetical protein